MGDASFWLLFAVGIMGLFMIGVAIALWYQYQVEPEDRLQQVPVAPRVTLPIHETNARTLKKLKPAEPEPEQLVEKDFDPAGAEQTRKTRLRELIRSTQTNA